MAFRGLLSKCNIRTPLFVSLAIVGTNYYVSHLKKHQLSYQLRPHLEFGPPFGPQFGLRRAHAKTVQEISKEVFPSVVSIHQVLSESRLGDNGVLKRYSDSQNTNRVLNTSSGFFVNFNGKSVLVTTTKAVGSAKYVDVYSASSGGHEVFEVVYREPELDLALLEKPKTTINVLSKAEHTGQSIPNDVKGLKLSAKTHWYADKVVSVGQVWNYNVITNGIISCPHRAGEEITKIGKTYGFISPKVDYIQHSASFAFDDIGGALIDMKSQVFGHRYYLQLIDNLTIYFAIPTNRLKVVFNSAKCSDEDVTYFFLLKEKLPDSYWADVFTKHPKKQWTLLGVIKPIIAYIIERVDDYSDTRNNKPGISAIPALKIEWYSRNLVKTNHACDACGRTSDGRMTNEFPLLESYLYARYIGPNRCRVCGTTAVNGANILPHIDLALEAPAAV